MSRRPIHIFVLLIERCKSSSSALRRLDELRKTLDRLENIVFEADKVTRNITLIPPRISQRVSHSVSLQRFHGRSLSFQPSRLHHLPSICRSYLKTLNRKLNPLYLIRLRHFCLRRILLPSLLTICFFHPPTQGPSQEVPSTLARPSFHLLFPLRQRSRRRRPPLRSCRTLPRCRRSYQHS